MIERRRLKNDAIFFQTVLSVVLSRKIIKIYNDIAQKHGNVTVKDFRKYEKSMLLNLIKNQGPNIDKIYLYVKDPFKSMYELLINRREKVGVKQLKNPKVFIDYSQTINDVYENLED